MAEEKETISWANLNKRWGDVLELIAAHLDVHSLKAYSSDGRLLEAPRPMLEDIICCRRQCDPRMIFYLNACGMNIGLIVDRPPKKHFLGVNQTPIIGVGGQHQIGRKRRKAK